MNCPRCGGRYLRHDREIDGDTTTCGSCGWTSDVLTVPPEIRQSTLLLHDDGTIGRRMRGSSR